MTEEQKKKTICGLVVGTIGLICIYKLAVHSQTSQKENGPIPQEPQREESHADNTDNLVSTKEIPKELRIQDDKGGVHFGGAPPGGCGEVGKPADADGHIIALGGSGSGKTTGVVNPTLGTWTGSVVALDCKGGMERCWRSVHPNDNKKLVVAAPHQKNGGPCAYDPYALIRRAPDHALEYAWDLAECLIPLTHSERDPVWIKSAQNVLAGAFLYYYDAGKNFAEAIQAINGLSISEIVDLICKSGNKRAQAFVSKIRGASEKTMASIGTEMNEVLRLVMNQEIIDFLTPTPGRTTLDWGSFNTQREPFDVILDIPWNKLKLYAPLIRLMVTQLVNTLSLRWEKTYTKQDLPGVLLMLDEFPQLGNIPVVVDALATLRSKGVTILLCAQSLAQLEGIYGKAVTRIILENCSYKVIFNAADPESQAYLSALIGGINVTTGSMSFNPSHGAGITLGEQRRPLIYPEALGRLKKPIVISSYGVCEVEKRPLYPPNTEPPPQADRINEQTAVVNDNREESPLSQADSHREKEGSSDGTEDMAKEAVMDSICAYCETPRSAKEIMTYFNVTGRTNFREKYFNSLLEQGRLKLTHPDKPRHPGQKYYRVKDNPNPVVSPDNTSAHLSIVDDKLEGEDRHDNG